jgi:hypothetical protein
MSVEWYEMHQVQSNRLALLGLPEARVIQADKHQAERDH